MQMSDPPSIGSGLFPSQEEFMNWLNSASARQREQMDASLEQYKSMLNSPAASQQGSPHRPPTSTYSPIPSQRPSPHRSTPQTSTPRVAKSAPRKSRLGGCFSACGGDDDVEEPRYRDDSPVHDAPPPDDTAPGYDAPPARAGPVLYYDIDTSGAIVEDVKGKEVLAYMRELCHGAFDKDMLRDWRAVPIADKRRVIDGLKRRFPNPPEHTFNDKIMIDRMRMLMSHRRSLVREAVKDRRSRPAWIPEEVWDQAVSQRRDFPEKFRQQETASQRRLSKSGTSHLGSGGLKSFHQYFVSFCF